MEIEREVVNLGSTIEIVGFKELDAGSMVILKKIVGNYAKKMSERMKNFEKIKLTMKPVHEREKSEIYEVKGHLFTGSHPIIAEETDRNLFFALDKVLKRLEESIE